MHEGHNVLLFLSERMKIGKVNKLLANLYDKKEYVLDIRNLKQALKFVSATFLLVCFVCLKEKTLETRKAVFLFHFDIILFVLEIIKF